MLQAWNGCAQINVSVKLAQGLRFGAWGLGFRVWGLDWGASQGLVKLCKWVVL